MKSKSILITSLVAIAFVAVGVYFWWFKPPIKPLFRQVPFTSLPGWDTAVLNKSLETFQSSCKTFVRQDPDRVVGTEHIELQAKDWQPACQAALKIDSDTEEDAKQFFQTWFTPVEFFDNKPVLGLFTGYYMPLLKGDDKPSNEYNVPLYEVPDNLLTIDLGLFIPEMQNKKITGMVSGKRVVPYYTRKQINKGAIKDHAKVLMWLTNPVDRLFLEIQGSGIIEMPNGERIYVGYDGQNGAPYTSIAGVLINKGIMTKDNASMQGIKTYLQANPDQMDAIINKNKSFVFFRKLTLEAALGSQGVALTPGYSMAIDKQWIPMGAPLWLSTTHPDSRNPEIDRPLQRLMIAQDTGGAIKGKVRGDVFWGDGENATVIAGHMKNQGHYWLLLPSHALNRMNLLK